MYKGIEHTAIATPDPEALASWYDKILNFPIVHRYAGNVFVRAPDGTMLEIIPSEGDPVKTEMKTPGIPLLNPADMRRSSKAMTSSGAWPMTPATSRRKHPRRQRLPLPK